MSHLSNPSLLLLRNEEELNGKNILVINPERDNFLPELVKLNPLSHIHAFSYDYADHLAAQKVAGVNSHVAHCLPVLADVDLIIYYYPKSKPEAQMMLDNIRATVTSQTRLLVVGGNKGGVKSVEKQFKYHAQAFYKLDSAKHCILYEFAEIAPLEQFNISNYQTRFDIKVAGVEFPVISVPGVFNHGKLDVGTQLLLETISKPKAGKVLDFGCGAGVIATFLAKKEPEVELSCLDVNALALYATEQTLALNELNAELILSDGLKNVEGRFKLVISNPPFHTGIATDYHIAEQFLSQAKGFLKSKGKLQIVANSFLKYPPILDDKFGEHTVLAKNTKFAVYQAERG